MPCILPQIDVCYPHFQAFPASSLLNTCSILYSFPSLPGGREGLGTRLSVCTFQRKKDSNFIHSLVPWYEATSFKMGLFLEDYEIYLGSLKYALCCRAGRQFAFSLESWEEKYFALER